MLEAKEILGTMHIKWPWLLAVGIAFVVLGMVGLGASFVLTMASVMIFGIILLIGGGYQFVDAFRYTGWKSRLSHILIAILYVIAGVIIMNDPMGASSIFYHDDSWGIDSNRYSTYFYGFSDEAGQGLDLGVDCRDCGNCVGRHDRSRMARIRIMGDRDVYCDRNAVCWMGHGNDGFSCQRYRDSFFRVTETIIGEYFPMPFWWLCIKFIQKPSKVGVGNFCLWMMKFFQISWV